MSAKRLAPFIAALFLLVCLLFVLVPRPQKKDEKPKVNQNESAVPAPILNLTVSNPPSLRKFPIRKRASEFTAEEKSEFSDNFQKRYKTAIQSWAKAYGPHIPLDPDGITLEKLVERVGADSSFNEYVFVVDGITISIRDSKGIAQVAYLNDPTQTQKMQVIPRRAMPPGSEMPLQRQEISDMVLADGGSQFTPDQIRMTPSGFSGGLDGGAIVHIGGDPRNGATWKYDLVFGADGKLAYYLRGM